MANAEFRYIGSHAEEIANGDKRVSVGPGDFVKLSDADFKAFDEMYPGLLISTAEGKKGGENS